MIRSFRDGGTEDLFHGRNTRAARRLPRDLWPTMRRRLAVVHFAMSLRDLKGASLSLEKLKRDLRGHHAIRVTMKYRITFRWEDGDAYEVHCGEPYTH